MINIEINGKRLRVDEGASIIEAADQVDIYIPRFCYHKKLSVAANCRMCLVEVEKVGKPLPACATPVTPDMKVFTQSQKALDAQRAVMEFLLVNHPLDCPICDQGGQCELQDLAMGYGAADSRYDEKKRAVLSQDIGPLIETEMTRCIHCTRCVRFGDEIAQLRELGVVNRGEQAEISTYIRHIMQSELSGNVIDLCPVGALTAKPSRYSVRGWEVSEHPMIAPHDCVGSHIYVHSKAQEHTQERIIMRVVPRENNAINETWISDRDRFSYQGVNHAERCLQPMIKQNDRWDTISWDAALQQVALRTYNIMKDAGVHQLAALSSSNATVEECFLWQRWLRALGGHNIDHRLHEKDFSDQASMPIFPGQNISMIDIETLDVIVLIGSNIRFEQPMISHRINKAVLKGAQVFVINPVDYTFTFHCAGKIITADIIAALAQLIRALETDQTVETVQSLADALKNAKRAAIFLGAFSSRHPHAAYLRAQLRAIAALTKVSVGILTQGSNAAGAYLAGALPHRGPAGAALHGLEGLTCRQLLVDQPVRAYFLLGFEPEYDTGYPAAAMRAMQGADFVVCFTSFVTDTMKAYADVILPITPFTENEGTLVNSEGLWQSFESASTAKGKSKPAWQVIRGLARAMQLTGFDYTRVTDIRDELKSQVDSRPPAPITPPSSLGEPPLLNCDLLRVGAYPMYCIDGVVRRAQSLQDTMDPKLMAIGLNAKEADKRGFSMGDRVRARQGDSYIILPIRIDPFLAEGIVSIPIGLNETSGFGEAMAWVELERVPV